MEQKLNDVVALQRAKEAKEKRAEAQKAADAQKRVAESKLAEAHKIIGEGDRIVLPRFMWPEFPCDPHECSECIADPTVDADAHEGIGWAAIVRKIYVKKERGGDWHVMAKVESMGNSHEIKAFDGNWDLTCARRLDESNVLLAAETSLQESEVKEPDVETKEQQMSD